MDAVTPTPLAMLLCVRIELAPDGNPVSLIGLTQRFAAVGEPPVVKSFAVYICITDGYGRVPFTLRIIDVDESRPPVENIRASVNPGGPLEDSPIALEVDNLILPAYGLYRAQLLCNDQIVIERRFEVVRASSV